MVPLKQKVNIMRVRHILPITILMLFGMSAGAADTNGQTFKAPRKAPTDTLIGTPLSRSLDGRQAEKKW